MKIAAIIAEYNPFHNGHKYHIEKTRADYGATHIAAIMSGSFCQRGDCACAPKADRVRMALEGGADLVLELPVPWALSGAEKFAMGGAYIANALGCVDLLSFGSECGDIEKIKKVSRALCDERFSQELKQRDIKGSSFAAARQQAVATIVGDELAALLESPNDNLGAEYIKALYLLNSKTEPVCVQRIGEHHGEASASHIRLLLDSEDGLGACIKYLPPSSVRILSECIARGVTPASMKNCERAVLYRCRSMSSEDFAALPDVSGGLEYRLFTCSRNAQSLMHYAELVKNKSVSHARIRRAICNAFLGISSQDCSAAPPYIRVLGFNARGREILAAAKPALPIISRHSDIKELDAFGARIFELEQSVTDIFGLCTPKIVEKGADSANKVVVLE